MRSHISNKYRQRAFRSVHAPFIPNRCVPSSGKWIGEPFPLINTAPLAGVRASLVSQSVSIQQSLFLQRLPAKAGVNESRQESEDFRPVPLRYRSRRKFFSVSFLPPFFCAVAFGCLCLPLVILQARFFCIREKQWNSCLTSVTLGPGTRLFTKWVQPSGVKTPLRYCNGL